jgi:UDP-N-acetylglucosamine 2-epimerase (hydrolysing)
MHLLSVFGSTVTEVEKAGFKNIFSFVNQRIGDSQDQIFSKTVSGLSDFLNQNKPDLIVVHGDRIEALAGAIVGALNNIFVGHIEGGEVSGTIDESIRHAITKFAHFHFVSNETARKRLLQLGEDEKTIFVVGSPDLDIMNSKSLPSLREALEYYEIEFDKYAIALLHPVTTELDRLASDVSKFVEALYKSKRNFLVIYPNNDPGFTTILSGYKHYSSCSRFRLIPSVRLEYFLTLLKNSEFIIGNSSSGVREAPVYAVPTINVGTRQFSRSGYNNIIHTDFDSNEIQNAIEVALNKRLEPFFEFGDGNTAKKFQKILKLPDFWERGIQKSFVGR